jgi:hypothetical protein
MSAALISSTVRMWHVDCALFWVHALENDDLVQKATTLVGRNTPAARES